MLQKNRLSLEISGIGGFFRSSRRLRPRPEADASGEAVCLVLEGKRLSLLNRDLELERGPVPPGVDQGAVRRVPEFHG